MSTAPRPVHEHEFEPQHGLPERLPAGERLLWQGAPNWQLLARRVFHVHHVALYFAALLVWHAGGVIADGGDLAQALRGSGLLASLLLLALSALLLLAWLSARTTVYTITDQRIVMRIGIVLTVAYNLPLRCIEAADLRKASAGSGDIALTLERRTRIAWLHLWPHARPWRVARPQPMLLALPDAQAVSSLLAQAWSAANGAPARPAAQAAPTPQLTPALDHR